MIVGPNAASLDVLLGNYHGVSSDAVNFVEGITAAVDPGTRVEYDQGCDFTDTLHFGGIWAAGNADVTIAVIGLTPVYEGEEGDAFLSNGDKKNLDLPAAHIAYMKALRKGHDKPIIAVITGGSALDVSSIEPFTDAIIYAWYPGEQGGHALADILFGKLSPSGRLPVTFYNSTNDLPAFENYSMKNRTYRYFTRKVQYPFGFGLSYTTFTYSWLKKPVLEKDEVSFSLKVKNNGDYNSDEVIQVYIGYPAIERMPVTELKGFKKLYIPRGKEATVSFKIPLDEIQKWDTGLHRWNLYPGEYSIRIGKNSNETILEEKLNIKY
jgi:beta-glucosidase